MHFLAITPGCVLSVQRPPPPGSQRADPSALQGAALIQRTLTLPFKTTLFVVRLHHAEREHNTTRLD